MGLVRSGSGRMGGGSGGRSGSGRIGGSSLGGRVGQSLGGSGRSSNSSAPRSVASRNSNSWNHAHWNNEPYDNEFDKDTIPRPRHPEPKQETVWISTPGGDIHLRFSIKWILYLISPTEKDDPRNIKHRVHCPKCEAISIPVKKGFFRNYGVPGNVLNGKYLSYVAIDATKLELNAFETHMENGKEVIAVCLECNHNRSPLSPFAIEQNAKIKEYLGPHHRSTSFCNKCKSIAMAVCDRHSGNEIRRTPDDPPITDFESYFFRCDKCGHEQDYES